MRTKDFIEIKPDNKSFILEIDAGLRKMGVNSILGFRDHLEIDFLDENGVTVDYPKDLLELPKEVESALLNSDMRLPDYAINRIVEYFEVHEYKIEEVIKGINTRQ
jgi:hypothetical protein